MEQFSLDVVATVLLDLAVIILATRAVGALFRRLGQPAVVGEVLAGIALGPSLLGAVPLGDATLAQVMFPPAARLQLAGLANLGLLIFMMIVGLELNLRPARANGRRAVVISVSSIMLPLSLGLLLGAWLVTRGEGGSSPFAFALFLGVAMSVTAFPVLARILSERRLHRTPLGVLVLACAGVDDVLAWSLLALATAVASGGNPWRVVGVAALLATFCAVLLLVVRPALRRLVAWHASVGRLTPPMLAVVVVGLLLSGAATEVIGVHFVFGAFLFGAVFPREHSGPLVRDLLDRLEQVAVLVLLPVFFVVTGLDVDVRSLRGDQLGVLAVVLLAACVGKFLGAAGAARLVKVPPRQAVAIGILMNTRGLTELVVVNVGFAAGLLSKEMLTVLVVMAVVTTVITKPLLQLAYPDAVIAREVADAERTALETPGAFRCVVLVDELARAASCAHVACDGSPVARGVDLVVVCLVPSPIPSYELAAGFSQGLGDIAARLEEASRLAASLTRGRVSCSVVSHFSDDVRADSVAQVAALEPDCVVADVRLDYSDDLVACLPLSSRLVLVDPGSLGRATGVAVSLRGGPDLGQALITGARIAAARHLVLGVVAEPLRHRSGRAAALVERLGRHAVQAEVWTAEQAAPALVIGERQGPASTGASVASVRSCRDDDVADLDRFLDEHLSTDPVQPWGSAPGPLSLAVLDAGSVTSRGTEDDRAGR